MGINDGTRHQKQPQIGPTDQRQVRLFIEGQLNPDGLHTRSSRRNAEIAGRCQGCPPRQDAKC
jgi:hypothetical protein